LAPNRKLDSFFDSWILWCFHEISFDWNGNQKISSQCWNNFGDDFWILHQSTSIPFHSIPFHSIPFNSIPFNSIPFHFISFSELWWTPTINVNSCWKLQFQKNGFRYKWWVVSRELKDQLSAFCFRCSKMNHGLVWRSNV
jgi:hypothetical protein